GVLPTRDELDAQILQRRRNEYGLGFAIGNENGLLLTLHIDFDKRTAAYQPYDVVACVDNRRAGVTGLREGAADNFERGFRRRATLGDGDAGRGEQGGDVGKDVRRSP